MIKRKIKIRKMIRSRIKSKSRMFGEGPSCS